MIFSYLLNMQSHPSWVCGLKPHTLIEIIILLRSHPSWVCGLKRTYQGHQKNQQSHTLRGCVD